MRPATGRPHTTRGRRVDTNHAAIVRTLRSCGATVLSLAPLGGAAPDLLVRARGRLHLLEVKRPGAGLTEAQHDFGATWGVAVVHDAREALHAVGLLV